ncbi:MAG: GNAT family N-acetyltransferase [Actinomycetota bacterium]|nr:GNAT family N-acetyltransferase [Actinomycetota bacterium]
MARLEIRPFSDEFIGAAAELLAARHRAQRQAEPLLPERYEDLAAASEEILALAETEGASGAVALRDGRVTGYLLGVRKSDEIWGANVWVELAGHAVEEPEDLRDLYGAAAGGWVDDDDRPRHYAVVPASEPALVDAWARVGFGQQHAYGIQATPEGRWPDGVRLATAADIEALLDLAPLLSDHQAQSPVFARGIARETRDELRAELLEDLAKDEIGDLVAERDGRLVGAFQVVPVERSSVHSGLARPEGAALLGWAATDPEVRGSGAGLALTEGSFAWAREHGYETMVTDWRVTNLLASRFWPARGFRTTFLRLYRHIP